MDRINASKEVVGCEAAKALRRFSYLKLDEPPDDPATGPPSTSAAPTAAAGVCDDQKQEVGVLPTGTKRIDYRIYADAAENHFVNYSIEESTVQAIDPIVHSLSDLLENAHPLHRTPKTSEQNLPHQP